MIKQRIEHSKVPDLVIQTLATRDAALWVGHGFDSKDQLDLLSRLIQLPWQLVLCESTSGSLATALESASQSTDRLSRKRGFVHVVASDPEGLILPPRSLPVFFLNGRADARDREESSLQPSRAIQRRRLNMINQLETARPRLLLVLSSGQESPLEDVLSLWEGGFRTFLTVISSDVTDRDRIDHWLSKTESAAAVDHCISPFISTVTDLIGRVSKELPEDRYVVRMRSGEKTTDFDITECELIEQPLLDRYILIRSRDVIPLQPDELSAEDFNAFFDRSRYTWTPYAAGLPWERNYDAREKLLKALLAAERFGSERDSILVISSESGAGGTTRARTLAFHAAREGYPTLVARGVKFHPEAQEIESFLYRVIQKVIRELENKSGEQPSAKAAQEIDMANDRPETPWLIVFDSQHWDGRLNELPAFLRAIKRSGRSAVLLVVTGPDIGDELGNCDNASVVERLRHELAEAEALSLGEHLNRFLRPWGKEKSEEEWRYFWEKHRPTSMETRVTSFWIALEFWLKGQLDLSESIQDWLYRHFRQANLTDDVRQVLLEIAALTIERQPYPEALLPPAPGAQFPFSVVLDDVRNEVPALALVCEGAVPNRQWAMAHDLLGRYLIRSTYFDRQMLNQLELSGVEDWVQMRLTLLRRIATRRELARTRFQALAGEFAVNILKLGTDGNLEFSRYWREVLDILENMPRAIWETSRTINHHVAISRRRVATTDELFHLGLPEKRHQLARAIEHLEYALYRLERSSTDDESDLNLCNSLSLAYQNLADVERELGADEHRLRELRQKATEAARRAQQENPTNSYVLETFARNLLQNGRVYPHDAAANAAEALGYIYQAMSLDRSLLREAKLTNLADEALRMLRAADASAEVDRVCAAGNPLGFLARSWLLLTQDEQHLTRDNLANLPKARLDAALDVLDRAPTRSDAMLLRFRYDLLTAGRAYDFEEQLNVLDELQGTGHVIPLQLQLEHAILLHQRNRHPEANIEFRHIREQIRSRDVYVDVPERLRWLLADGKRRICHARVLETRDFKSWAKVRDLKDISVPFIPQEFGQNRMPAGMSITCTINFGPMGPFIKPPVSDG